MSDESASGDPRLERGSLEWASIVIVDDTAQNVQLLERILSAAGAPRVRGFTDPLEAIAACAAERPDLVLLDLHMPQLDGLGVMERLNAGLEDDGFLPVIVLTADITEDARRRVLAAGAKDFLTKPFDVTEVVLRVKNLLDTTAGYRRLERHNTELRDELEATDAARRAASAEREEREARIDRVLTSGALEMHYQPDAEIATGRLVGAEALARFQVEPRRPPNEWFAEAASVGRGLELELRAVELAVADIPRLPPDVRVSINASPAAVCSGGFAPLVADRASRVVLELTEHERVDDYDPLLAAIADLRALGLRLAVDDTGAGYSSLRHILRLDADILKLDIALTQGIDRDPVRRSLAAALVTFSDDIGAGLVAEGVETEAELQTLRALGVRWAQGYHLGRPAPLPLRLLDRVVP